MTISTSGAGDNREVTQTDVDDSVADGTLFTTLTNAFANDSFESVGLTNEDPNKSIRAIVWDIRKFTISGDFTMAIPRNMSLTMLINGGTIFTSDEFRIDGNIDIKGYFSDNANPLDSASYNLTIRTLRVSDSSFKQLEGATYFGSGVVRLSNCIYDIASPINAFSNPNGTVHLDRVWLQAIDRSYADGGITATNVYNRSKKEGSLRNVICSLPFTLFTIPTIENFTLLGGGGVTKLIINGVDRYGTGDNAVIDGINTIGDVSVESTGSPRIDIINGALGTQTPITTVGFETEKRAGVRFFKRVKFKLLDINNNPIEGGVIRLIQRKTGLETQFLSYCTNRIEQTYDKYDETTDDQIIYEWVSDVNGDTNEVLVRLGYEWWNFYINSNANTDITEGQKTVPQMEDSEDNAQFGAYLVGNKLDFNIIQLREYNATKVITAQALPILEYEHTESQIASFNHYDTTIKLFEGIRYWEKTNKEIIRYIGATNSLVNISTGVVTIRSGWDLKLVAGNGDITVDNTAKLITVPIGNGNFSGDYRLIIDGDFIKNGVNVRVLYEYVNANGRVVTSHHIYPTTDLNVIAYSNKQNIHIHAKYRDYRRLSNVTVLGKNGNQIVTSASFPSVDLLVGNVVSPSGSTGDIGVKVTLISSASQVTSFEVVDASGFNAGDPIYVSTNADILESNLLELEDQVGQISHYFEYEKLSYYEIELDVFGDIKRSINTYAELGYEVTPLIEVIAGAAEIGTWRTERANGVTVNLTDTEITPSGNWEDKSPEQLLWNIRESITEWNKAHPNKEDKRYEIDYFETTGTFIIWHKEFTELSGFYTSKVDIYNRFIYVDANADLLLIDVGLETETTTKFGLRVKGVEVGDKIAYIVDGESTFIALEEANVSTSGETVVVLDKGSAYQMRVRRKGVNDPLVDIDDTIRSVTALFIGVPNVQYENSFVGDITTIFAWDDVDNRLKFLQSIDTNVQNNLDALWEYNYLFPQGVLGDPLINSEYGFLENVLTLNYKTIVDSHIETRSYHKDAVYEALAIQTGHNADGSPKYSYLTSAEIDPLNAETFVVHYHHNYENAVSTTGTKALLETPTLTNNVEVLLNEDESHIVHEVIPLILDILDSRQDGANSGTLTFNQGVPIQLPYNKIYRLFHKVSDAEDVVLEVVVYSFIRVKVQIRTLNDDGSFTDADDHITWGVHETLQGGFTDHAKQELTETLDTTKEIAVDVDVVKSDSTNILNNLKDMRQYDHVEFAVEHESDSTYLLLKKDVIYGNRVNLTNSSKLKQYKVYVSDGGLVGYEITAVIRKMNSDGTLGELVAEQHILFDNRVNSYLLYDFGNIDLPKGEYFFGVHGQDNDYHAITYADNHIGYYTVDNVDGAILVETHGKGIVSELDIISYYTLADIIGYENEMLDLLVNGDYGLEALQLLIKAINQATPEEIADLVKMKLEQAGSLLHDTWVVNLGDYTFSKNANKSYMEITKDGVTKKYEGIEDTEFNADEFAGGRKDVPL